jgi:pyruvate carboxylase
MPQFDSRAESTPMLFVYGTLRHACGHQMHRLLAEHAEFVGEATIQGRLYLVGEFPGAVETASPEDRVQGEVYSLNQAEELLTALDAYEDFDPQSPGTSLYRRDKAMTLLRDGKTVEAWVYFYNRPTAGLRPIPSGDFLQVAAHR